jgi:hypothetical protein
MGVHLLAFLRMLPMRLLAAASAEASGKALQMREWRASRLGMLAQSRKVGTWMTASTSDRGATVLQVALEAIDQEIAQWLRRILQQTGCKGRRAICDQAWGARPAMRARPACGSHPAHGAAAQRVLVAGRQVADAEHADQCLQLVCQRQDDAGPVAGQCITGKTRPVMVFDRLATSSPSRHGGRSSRP